MKKLGIILGVVVVLIALLVVLTKMSNSDKLENNPYGTDDLQQPTIDLLDDENYQNIILPADLKEKIASGEPTVAYMFSPTCTHCQNFTPKLMPIAKELGVEVNQLNLLEFDSEWTTFAITATPTLIYFENGQEVTRLVGDYEEDAIRGFFNGYVLK